MSIGDFRGRPVDLDQPCTQQAFAELVGVTQPTVSGLVSKGVLLPGQSAREWLHRYLTHLREAIIARWSSQQQR